MSRDYQNIEITDGLLMAYINEELSANKMKIVEVWLNSSKENQVKFQSLKNTWEATGELEPKPVLVNTEEAWKKVRSKIDTTPIIPISKMPSKLLQLAIGVAAALVLLLVTFTFWNQKIVNIEVVASNKIIKTKLVDGSSITINKNSQLIYPESFNENERRVQLSGNAYFDIAKDSMQPFIIDLPEARYVKVLGTSFTINTDDINKTETVFVKTGKVEFGNGSEKLILLPGEKGIFYHETKKFEKVTDKRNKAEALYWINKQLIFEGESLHEIIIALSNIFQTDIELHCPQAANYPIVSNHEQENLDEILEVISLVHNLTISKTTTKGKTAYTISCND